MIDCVFNSKLVIYCHVYVANDEVYVANDDLALYFAVDAFWLLIRHL